MNGTPTTSDGMMVVNEGSARSVALAGELQVATEVFSEEMVSARVAPLDG